MGVVSNEFREYIQYRLNEIGDNITTESIDMFLANAAFCLEEFGDMEYSLELTGIAKKMCAKLILDRDEYDVSEMMRFHDFCAMKKINVEEMSHYWKILLWEAQHKVLDSYLLYIEKNRLAKDRFYAPKRTVFMKIGVIQALQDLIDDKLDTLSISLPPGTGKAGDMDSLVLTPDGYVKMRDIHVGDSVISGTGNVAKVLGVYPQGKRPMYKLTMDDGSSTIASDNHLWKVQTRDDRCRGNKYRIVETKDMLKNLYVECNKRKNYSLDYVPRIEFKEKQHFLHPYVLGCLLGDGCLVDGIGFTKKDKEIVERMNSLMDGYEFVLKSTSDTDYYIRSTKAKRESKSQVREELKRLNLLGTKSYTKFIPKEYMYDSYNNRLELLKGLLDTDGWSDSCGVGYCTTSEQLSKDVRELVHSLGGYCSVAKKPSGYKNKDGEYVKCKDAYILTIQFSANHPSPFYLKRKSDVYKPKRTIWKRYISNIEYIGDRECQCIYISDESHLYITDNYIITHNTTLEKFFHSAVMGWFPEEGNLFFSHSSDITRMYYDGVLAIVTDDLEYTWGEIFPDSKVTNTNAKMGQITIDKYKPFPNLQTGSVSSEMAGKVRASKFLFVDDMIGKIEEALNKSILDKLWNIYTSDLLQRKTVDENEKPCKELMIATRWSVHDIIGRLKRDLEGDKRARFIAVPDIDPETGESNFMFESKGFSTEFFHKQEKFMDEITYRCLYKNDPIEREGLLYKEDKIRRYASLPTQEPDAVLAICDTKTTGIDYMFLPVFAQYGNDYYMIDCICDDNTDFDVQIARITDILMRNKVQKCEFESNAGGSRLAYDVENNLKEKGYTFCNITTKATESNKETRIIINAEWIIRQCLFKFKEDYDTKSDYGKAMNFMLTYSVAGKNKFDDVVDGLANFRLFVESMTVVTGVAKAAFNPFRSYRGW